MSAPVRIFMYQYGEIALLDNYDKALSAAGMQSLVSTQIEDCLCCDGLLLPGGYDSDPSLYGQKNIACRNIDLNRDHRELELIRIFVERKRPILGICRGHQLLNIAFHGDLIQDIDTKERHMQRDGIDQLHKTKIAPKSTLSRLYGAGMVTCSAHHQAVGRLGDGFRAVQWVEDGVIEAIEHESLPILGLQWHPERQSYGRRRRGAADGAPVFEYFRKLCQK